MSYLITSLEDTLVLINSLWSLLNAPSYLAETTNLEVEEFTLSHFMGIMGGVGIGLIIGGIVGYVSKGSSIKAEQKRKELQRLHQARIEIEKQAAELAQQNVNPNPNNSDNSNL